MKRTSNILIIIVVPIFFISLAATYYFLITLPNIKEREVSVKEQAEKRLQNEAEKKEIKELEKTGALQDCLIIADADYQKRVESSKSLITASGCLEDPDYMSTPMLNYCSDLFESESYEIEQEYQDAQDYCYFRYK